MNSFDFEILEQLGPRPPLKPGVYSQANRDWDLKYQALFPSDILPSYHESHRKKSTGLEKGNQHAA